MEPSLLKRWMIAMSLPRFPIVLWMPTKSSLPRITMVISLPTTMIFVFLSLASVVRLLLTRQRSVLLVWISSPWLARWKRRRRMPRLSRLLLAGSVVLMANGDSRFLISISTMRSGRITTRRFLTVWMIRTTATSCATKRSSTKTCLLSVRRTSMS